MICRWFYMVLQFKKKGLQCYKFGNQWWCFPAQTSGLSWKRFTILCVPFLVLIPTIIQSHWGLAVAHPRILEVALTVPWKNPFHVRWFSCKSYRKTSKNHHRKKPALDEKWHIPIIPLDLKQIGWFPPFPTHHNDHMISSESLGVFWVHVQPKTGKFQMSSIFSF